MNTSATMYKRYHNYMENPYTDYRRPMPFTPYSNYDRRAFSWADKATPVHEHNMNGLNLDKLRRDTDYMLSSLAEGIALEGEPCHQYGIKHWHPDQRPKSAPSTRPHQDTLVKPKWQNSSVMFGSNPNLDDSAHCYSKSISRPLSPSSRSTRSRSSPSKTDESEESDTEFDTSLSGPLKTYCYLCSTVDEHKKHMLRFKRMKPKPKSKPRIEYIPPRPSLPHKKKPVYEEGPPQVLYKIDVKTGVIKVKDKKTLRVQRKDTGTDANVEIIIKGSKSMTNKKKLHKNTGSLTSFQFGPGTVETFYVRAPELGNLQQLQVEHDGLSRSHSWFLEWIKVINMTTKQTWKFECKRWLSLYEEDFAVKRVFKAEEMEKAVSLKKEYEIKTVTGKGAEAGTDCNVYITLCGKGKESPAIHLIPTDKSCFRKGSVDSFSIKAKNVGELNKIRIEHDGSGSHPHWFLKQVQVKDVAEGVSYVFPCSKWLSVLDGHNIWIELLPTGRGSETMGCQPKKGKTVKVDYTVHVTTGKKRGAGTNAQVFVQIFGRNLNTGKLILEKSATNEDAFENGKTDVFKLSAPNVGIIKKILIGHNNEGFAAGWYLDKVIIQKMLTKEEVASKLSRIQGGEKQDREAMEKSLAKKSRSKKKIHKSDSEESDFEDSKSTKRLKKKKHNKRDISSESESSDREIAKKSKETTEKPKRSSHSSFLENFFGRKTEQRQGEEKTKENKKKGRKQQTETSESEDSETEEEKPMKMKRGKSRAETSDSEESKNDKPLRKSKSTQKNRNSKSYNAQDSDDDGIFSRKSSKNVKGHSKKSKYRGQNDHSDSESEMEKEKPSKIPYCDQYEFPCDQWFAEDEGDGKLERELFPENRTVLFESA